MDKKIAVSDHLKSEPYPFIYVNADGSVRELHAGERDYLETPFSPFDGGRPYVKDSYSQKNGWGKITGYLERAKLPPGTQIHPAPAEDLSRPPSREEQMQFLRDKGMEITENSDGTFTARKQKR